MKRSYCCLLLVVIFCLTACGTENHTEQELQPMSFEYELVEEDVEEAYALIEQLDNFVDCGEDSKIVPTELQMEAKIDYIYHQYLIGKIEYYSDLEDDVAYERYDYSQECYMDVNEARLDVLKKLYFSDLSAKEEVFADWTEREKKALEMSGEEVVRRKREQQDLMDDYLALDDPESEEWSAALEEIYLKFVSSAQALAQLLEYNNYYDYAAEELYQREYTKEQRIAFRENVKTQLIPFWGEIDALYREKKEQLGEEQKELFASLRKSTCLPSNEYLKGYIDSYPAEMKKIMNYLFERDALVYSESENAYVAAYTEYSKCYDQPYIFLGNSCQNMLTLVHELGHYVAYYHFEEEKLPYDTAEVQSQGNEWLMLEYLDGKLDKNVYDTFLLWRLRQGLDTIIISTLIDDFEERVYNREEILSASEFEVIMTEMLQNYPHVEQFISKEELYIYSQYVTMEAPVYYLSYATSELVSMMFFAIANEEGYENAQDIYMRLCLNAPTGERFLDTLCDVGLPDPFDTETVEKIIDSYEDAFNCN